jgi:hypothetical protein
MFSAISLMQKPKALSLSSFVIHYVLAYITNLNILFNGSVISASPLSSPANYFGMNPMIIAAPMPSPTFMLNTIMIMHAVIEHTCNINVSFFVFAL